MASAGKEEDLDLDLDEFDEDLQQSPPRALSKAEEEELARSNEMIANGDKVLRDMGIDPKDPRQTRYLDLDAPLVEVTNEQQLREQQLREQQLRKKKAEDAAYAALMEYLRKRPFKAKSRPYITKKTPKGGSRRRARSRGNRRKSRRTKRRTRRRTRRSRK